MWHPFVTCGHCGHIHECLRLIAEPCSFTLVCHDCERMLSVSISSDQIAKRRKDDRLEKHLGVEGLATLTPLRWTEEHGVS